MTQDGDDCELLLREAGGLVKVRKSGECSLFGIPSLMSVGRDLGDSFVSRRADVVTAD